MNKLELWSFAHSAVCRFRGLQFRLLILDNQILQPGVVMQGGALEVKVLSTQYMREKI